MVDDLLPQSRQLTESVRSAATSKAEGQCPKYRITRGSTAFPLHVVGEDGLPQPDLTLDAARAQVPLPPHCASLFSCGGCLRIMGLRQSDRGAARLANVERAGTSAGTGGTLPRHRNAMRDRARSGQTRVRDPEGRADLGDEPPHRETASGPPLILRSDATERTLPASQPHGG